MYLLVPVVALKMKRLFYFCLFIGVIGAFLALFFPNYGDIRPIMDPRLQEFMIGHYIPFFMPILLVAFGIFERPMLKHFGWSMLAFAGYFVFILFANPYLTLSQPPGANPVDFFFLNRSHIVDILGEWAVAFRDIEVSIVTNQGVLIFYPLYQALFFAGFVGFTIALWFLYELGFSVADNWASILSVRKKIKIDEYALKSRGGEQMSNDKEKDDKCYTVEIVNFSKRYGNSTKFAVEKANLKLHSGEIFGFLGPNGAGKSTIIKSLVGIQPITSGSISICGYDVATQSIQAKSRTGFVPDHYALYEHLTGREYVNYIADIYNVPGPERNETLDQLVDAFEISHAFDNQIKTYSHGMKQKIAILSALVHNPKLWVLDEPLTGLDPNSIMQVRETMKAHAKAGNIVFFSSHIIDVVEKLVDRIAIISKGKILATATIKEVQESGISSEQFYIKHVGKKGAERL